MTAPRRFPAATKVLLGCLHPKLQLNDLLDNLHAVVQPDRRAVQAEVVIFDPLPLAAGVVLVIALAVMVELINVPDGLIAADALPLHLPLDAILVGGVDVNGQHVGLVF